MRSIRFRAWDKKRNEWFENQYKWYGFTIIGECTMFDMPHIDRLQDMIFMQYTGLKDRSEREIYEGDILIWQNRTDETDQDIEPVTFEYGKFVCGSDDLGDLDLDSMEVIGNIYENPELLGGGE